MFGVERLHWFGWNWQLYHSGWNLLLWWPCWLVTIGLVGWCRRLGALRPQQWRGEPEWMGGGFGFDQWFVLSLRLGEDIG
jgi:hypothetical protein